ncbi:MAG: hypothetical protein ABIJ96_04485 [Elusimicrobiota bacterium]
MTNSGSHKLRLKLPSGAEMEAEGTPEFIAGERREFTSILAAKSGGAVAAAGGSAEPSWDEIIETRGKNDIQLRAKLGGGGGDKEACLVLIAASRALLRTPKPTAAQLAKWLRASGYPIQRVDRAIQASVSRGDILASGSRRARRYELSGPGLAKAFNLALQLARMIRPSD